MYFCHRIPWEIQNAYRKDHTLYEKTMISSRTLFHFFFKINLLVSSWWNCIEHLPKISPEKNWLYSPLGQATLEPTVQIIAPAGKGKHSPFPYTISALGMDIILWHAYGVHQLAMQMYDSYSRECLCGWGEHDVRADSRCPRYGLSGRSEGRGMATSSAALHHPLFITMP